MSLYLNKKNDSFKISLNSQIFIDKTLIIKETNSRLQTEDRFMCVTRPRRFGKTMALAMLNAYYSKGCDSKELFNGLKITSDESFNEHLNKHNVIWIDMSSVYTDVKDKNSFVNELSNEIIQDLKEAYPNILTNNENTIRKCFNKLNSTLGERFIFLIDEWDVIYREQENNVKLCDEFTLFLRNLFKSSDVSSCIDLVYMTGILPIKRYSTQSTLNMFTEYNMIDSDNLSTYFGFTEDEVKELCVKYNRDFNEIKSWYDGYKLNGIDIYNPKSVVEAVSRGICKNYWTKTSALEAVTNYMNYDKGVLKDTIARMLIGEKVDVNVSRFENDLTKVNSTDSALTVLIHLGYLAYIPGGEDDHGYCYIPNFEIKREFERGIEELNWTELYDPISNSINMYNETIKLNTNYINETLDRNHKEIANIFNKNKDDILGVVVYMSYYKAKNFYNVKKEDTTTLGRADLTYIPYDNNHIPFIIELKANNETPDDAIKQIKEREYIKSLGSYHGDVLLIGITYDEATLKHDSKIEVYKI